MKERIKKAKKIVIKLKQRYDQILDQAAVRFLNTIDHYSGKETKNYKTG